MSSSKTRDFPVEETTKSLSLENNAYDKEVISHDMCNEMTDAQREAIVYRSKLLNKYFESYDDMLKEEAEFKRLREEKIKQVEEKKARAKEVEDAYLEYQKVKEDCLNKMAEAEKKWLELRDKFAKDYHGYHMTYVNHNGKKEVSFSDLLDCFFNW